MSRRRCRSGRPCANRACGRFTYLPPPAHLTAQRCKLTAQESFRDPRRGKNKHCVGDSPWIMLFIESSAKLSRNWTPSDVCETKGRLPDDLVVITEENAHIIGCIASPPQVDTPSRLVSDGLCPGLVRRPERRNACILSQLILAQLSQQFMQETSCVSCTSLLYHSIPRPGLESSTNRVTRCPTKGKAGRVLRFANVLIASLKSEGA